MSGQQQARPPVLPISGLGLLTIVAYGACYYAYGVLIQPIGADTHWPDAALEAIFSAILVITGVLGAMAGRLLERCGPRLVFLLAAVAGTGGMLAASAQSALLPFAITYAGGCGLVGALGFTTSRRRLPPALRLRRRARHHLADALRRLFQPGVSPADRVARPFGRVAGHDPDPGRHGAGRVPAGSCPDQESWRVRAGPAR